MAKMISVWFLLLMCLGFAPAAEGNRPNIVVLVIDDLGWGDLSCNGGRTVATPHLDALLRRGMSFTNGYVAAPICAPSRSAILTGRCPARLGLTANHQPLPLGERTLAEILHANGYATAAFGKWHQSGEGGEMDRREFLPTSRGFDVFDGVIGHSGRTDPKGVAGDIDRCLDFLKEHAGKPCFVYDGLGPVHTPLTRDPAYLAAVKGDDIAATRRQYLACLLGLDDAIGSFADGMDKAGAWKDTIVWLINDNGGKLDVGSTNAPWRGGKYSLFEGGIHVPFSVIAEGRIARGIHDGLVSSMDILPTTLAAIGVPIPSDRPLDGIDLWPQCSAGEKPDPARMLFWRGSNGCEHGLDCTAVRMGRWKFHHRVDGGKSVDALYDITADPGETRDCAAEHPDVVATLRRALDGFGREIAAPPARNGSAGHPHRDE